MGATAAIARRWDDAPLDLPGSERKQQKHGESEQLVRASRTKGVICDCTVGSKPGKITNVKRKKGAVQIQDVPFCCCAMLSEESFERLLLFRRSV